MEKINPEHIQFLANLEACALNTGEYAGQKYCSRKYHGMEVEVRFKRTLRGSYRKTYTVNGYRTSASEVYKDLERKDKQREEWAILEKYADGIEE